VRLSGSVGTLSPDFVKTTTEYTLTLPYAKNSVTLTAAAESALSTLKIDGTAAATKTFSSLTVGSIVKQITVTSEAGGIADIFGLR
jgi:hypothetical protein